MPSEIYTELSQGTTVTITDSVMTLVCVRLEAKELIEDEDIKYGLTEGLREMRIYAYTLQSTPV